MAAGATLSHRIPTANPMTAPILTLEAAAALALDDGSAIQHSALGAQPWLLFENRGQLEAEQRNALIRWLRHAPCPTLVIDLGGHAAITHAADAVLGKAEHAQALIRNISACPFAAALLVQLLRNSEQLDMPTALAMESLTYATLQSGPEYLAWLAANRAPALVQPTDAGAAVLTERAADTVKLTLNRASNRNAINMEMRDALNEAFALVAMDASIASVVVNALGKCFSIGGDLSEFGSVTHPVSGYLVRDLALPARHLLKVRERVQFHVHGACIGAGIELPALATRLTASPNSFFQLPELRFGLIPGAGGCVSIPRRIGRQRAAWLMLSGKKLSAAKALEWGLVDALV